MRAIFTSLFDLLLAGANTPTPLPPLEEELGTLEAKVEAHPVSIEIPTVTTPPGEFEKRLSSPTLLSPPSPVVSRLSCENRPSLLSNPVLPSSDVFGDERPPFRHSLSTPPPVERGMEKRRTVSSPAMGVVNPPLSKSPALYKNRPSSETGRYSMPTSERNTPDLKPTSPTRRTESMSSAMGRKTGSVSSAMTRKTSLNLPKQSLGLPTDDAVSRSIGARGSPQPIRKAFSENASSSFDSSFNGPPLGRMVKSKTFDGRLRGPVRSPSSPALKISRLPDADNGQDTVLEARPRSSSLFDRLGETAAQMAAAAASSQPGQRRPQLVSLLLDMALIVPSFRLWLANVNSRGCQIFKAGLIFDRKFENSTF